MANLVDSLALSRVTGGEKSASSAPEAYSLMVLRGTSSVLSAETAIELLRARTRQDDNPLLRLSFFVERVSLFPGNRPVVLLVFEGEHLEGAVYLYEKTNFGIPTGYLRGFDHLTGESSVIAAEPRRAHLLQFAIHQLFLQSSVRVAWATVSLGATQPFATRRIEHKRLRLEASSMLREHRLQLGETFDATLSRFGAHTRRNLRYYRRRAEKDLGQIFQAQLSYAEGEDALQQLGKSSFQPFPVSLTEWRQMDGLLRKQPGYFSMGLRSNGVWLSYLAGMRVAGLTYVLIQINHDQYARYSLSTVLRSYFFENEILLGQSAIKFVNGTCAQFQRCCEPDVCLTVSGRRGLAAFVISQWIAPWHSAADHALNITRWTRGSDPSS